MKQKGVILLFLILAVGPAPSSANSELIVLDPDDFTVGTDISNAFPGAALSAIGTAPTTPTVFVGNRFNTNIFAHDGPIPEEWGRVAPANFDTRLRIDFDIPAKHVVVDFLPNDSFDPGLLEVFNIADELLDAVNTPGMTTSGMISTARIDRSQGDIAYALTWSLDATALFIDKVGFLPVPEPLSLVLVSVFLFGLHLRASRSAR